MKKLILLLSTQILLFACTSEFVNEKNVNPDIRVSNSMLVFKNTSIYEKTLNLLSSKNRCELDEWESSIKGFTSQRFIYENAIDADYEHKNRLQKLIEDNKITKEEVIRNDEVFDPYVKKHLNLFNLDGTGSFDLKIEGYSPYIEYVINDKGLVQIGNEIRYYGDDKIKVIMDGNLEKLPLLKNTDESSIDNGIMIFSIHRENGLMKKPNLTAFTGDQECTGQIGSEKVVGKSVLGYHLTNDIYGYWGPVGGIVISPYAYLNATNYKKGVFGWSKKRTSSLRIEGVVSYDVGISSGSNIVVHADTGGDLEKSISYYVFSTIYYYPIPPNTPPNDCCIFHEFSGSAEFHGRSNTACFM